MSPAIRRAGLVLVCALTVALYLAQLTAMGMVGPDEPRYAAVGRAMALSGDWITPRLWGHPWFEKPALLYWVTAAGFRMGLGPDLAPRLPVALLGLGFLVFFWWRLRIEWGARVASYATAMLATSAGWLTYSHVAVTDLPLSAFFAAAVLLSLPWLGRGDRTTLPAAAACLGLASLAKGLVPLVLFAPLLILGWRRLADWLRPATLLAFAVCALPWYILCTAVNGREFLKVFFIEHQLGRFSSAALQHVQPWWFYIPATLLLLYPWFPLVVLTKLADWKDSRTRALIVTAVFGFVFFSASVNKLPSYVLPLLPVVCILIAQGLSRTSHPNRAVVAPMALLALLPVISLVIPIALARGLRAATIPWTEAGIALAIGTTFGLLLSSTVRRHALTATFAIAGIGFMWVQINSFPALDSAASARPLWLRDRPSCITKQPRAIIYGLSYYAELVLPECSLLDQSNTRGVR